MNRIQKSVVIAGISLFVLAGVFYPVRVSLIVWARGT